MKKPKFAKDQIYHIYNRGVEKRNVFMDEKDYFVFIHDLFEFNDKNPALEIKLHKLREVQPPEVKRYRRSERDPIVEILAFVLMPNHFHFILKETVDGGIIKFMQKLGTGYTMYFNKRYDRVGSLFQGRFKAVLIEKDAHFIYLPNYIHLNPLDLMTSKTSGGSTSRSSSRSWEEKIRFLENYRWSSFPDYIGNKNFPSITSRTFLLDFFGGSAKYKKEIINWLKNEEYKPNLSYSLIFE